MIEIDNLKFVILLYIFLRKILSERLTNKLLKALISAIFDLTDLTN